MKRIVAYVLLVMFLVSCGDQEMSIPKPRMYPKVDYPQRTATDFDQSYCDMSFQYPDYFKVVQDEYIFGSTPNHPCWFDLESSDLNSQLHCSYIEIKDRKHFDKLVQDAFKMTNKHNQKANYRKEQLIENKDEKVYGLLFEHEGPSIAPVYDFVRTDVLNMIESFKWN